MTFKLTSFLMLPTSAWLVGCAGTASKPPANDPATLRVNVFRSATNIPIYMAESNCSSRPTLLNNVLDWLRAAATSRTRPLTMPWPWSRWPKWMR